MTDFDSSCTSDYNWYWVNRIGMSPDGTTLLAATRGYYGNWGNIYRSTDGGVSWTPTQCASFWDVKFDPNNSSNALATGRDYNFSTEQWESHIYRTTNGGSTWTETQTWSDSSGRIELGWAPGTLGTAYAVRDANSGTLYKTTDGGSSWSTVSTPGHLGAQGWYDNTIWVSPTDSNLVVVGGIDTYRSTNGGSTWTQISQWWNWPTSAHADHHVIVHHPTYNGSTNKTVFFGNDGGIWKAADVTTVAPTSGWTNLNSTLGITQFYGGSGAASAGSSPMILIGGTQDNGHLHYNGSLDWTQTNGGDGGFTASDPGDGNYMYGEYVNLTLYRSTNGGSTYNNICSGITEANTTYCKGSGEALFIAP
ncbi:MAG: hypothetical protein D3908_14890, partial [Candidatus Electrothrix sp. AUS4]|nr:hypothetical protein [Candidatus Electrothrix sp. AUS4]